MCAAACVPAPLETDGGVSPDASAAAGDASTAQPDAAVDPVRDGGVVAEPDAGSDAGVTHDAGVTDAGPPSPTAPFPVASLSDYWAGRARWQLVRKYTRSAWPANTDGFNFGTHITVVGDTWYLFGRSYHWLDKPAGCDPSAPGLGVQVRASRDQGKTWGPLVEIIAPRPGSRWQCMATDGDAFFNPTENGGTWHYLFQCFAPGGPWQGCHLAKKGADPSVGTWVETVPNPAVPAKSLWNRICNTAADDCARIPGGVGRVYDEGTFNIFRFDGTFYWVSFHGASDSASGVHGYRGIAKTRDFGTWVAGDPAQGVPGDAVFDEDDAAAWRESWQGGNVGPGAGSILEEGGHAYQIQEVADRSLACTTGQNWDWGMERTNALTSTRWEQLPAGNPFYYSSHATDAPGGQRWPCTPGYGRLFKDPLTGATYSHFSRDATDFDYQGVFLYQLTPTANALNNGDLWKCNAEGWKVLPSPGSTNLVVYRSPNQASDANCFLESNCGGACSNGQSFYQDVDAVALRGRKVEFGGKFFGVGGPVSANLVLWQLSAGAPKATEVALVAPKDGYSAFRGEATIDAATTTLRFQLYLQGAPLAVRADEMFIEPR